MKIYYLESRCNGRVSGAHAQPPTVDAAYMHMPEAAAPAISLIKVMSAAAKCLPPPVFTFIAFLHCDLVPYKVLC